MIVREEGENQRGRDEGEWETNTTLLLGAEKGGPRKLVGAGEKSSGGVMSCNLLLRHRGAWMGL